MPRIGALVFGTPFNFYKADSERLEDCRVEEDPAAVIQLLFSDGDGANDTLQIGAIRLNGPN